MGLTGVMGPVDQPCKVQLPQTLGLSLFPDGCVSPIGVSGSVKKTRGSDDQCILSLFNTLTLRIKQDDKALLPKIFEIGFYSIIWGTGASSRRIRYANLFAKPQGRCQPFQANSKVVFKAGNRPSSRYLRRKTATDASTFPAVVTSSGII